MYFDSHAHLDDRKFDADREALIESLEEHEVTSVLNAGADMVSSVKSVELAERYDFIYASVGVHPHDAANMKPSDIRKLEELALNQNVVAIGEIGLDYYYCHSPKDIQREVFIKQLKLAVKLDMPVIIHARDAHGDLLKILNEAGVPKAGGVMHCYSGSWEMAKQYMALNLYISFAGPVTYKNAIKTVEVVKNMPFERILIETDCPYLAPVPYRGKRNFPGYIRHTAEKIAHIKGTTVERIAGITTDNAKALFRLI